MNHYSINKKEEDKDRIKSAIITAIIWSILLLFIFFYSIKSIAPIEKEEQITTMLINFGDNRNGNGEEEPAEQEGSLASETTLETEDVVAETAPVKPVEVIPSPSKETKKESVKEKILTGKNNNLTIPDKKKESITDTKASKSTPASTSNKSNTNATTTNSTIGNGDGKGTAAVGNLIKGRGTKAGSQGTGSGIGNDGDPLGGDGNGDSKVGVDRKLIGFIPGTMGRGGAQPTHQCSASGSITISYMVDKAGNVTTARRLSGSSDPCLVNTTIAWVKQYVKAEKANVSSTGSYKITF